MKVLVTGGTGFLGRHLVERLALEGDEVWVLARGGQSDAELRGLGVHVVPGDVRQWSSLRRAVEGKDVDLPLRGQGRSGRALARLPRGERARDRTADPGVPRARGAPVHPRQLHRGLPRAPRRRGHLGRRRLRRQHGARRLHALEDHGRSARLLVRSRAVGARHGHTAGDDLRSGRQEQPRPGRRQEGPVQRHLRGRRKHHAPRLRGQRGRRPRAGRASRRGDRARVQRGRR